MEKNLKKDIYMYNWITLLYTWNIVNQLYFNKINKSESGIELYLFNYSWCMVLYVTGVQWSASQFFKVILHL